MSFVPMVAGSLYEHRFRPEGTPAHYLSIPTPQNSWQRYVRKDELDYFRRHAAHWREFVHAMAEWVRVNNKNFYLLMPIAHIFNQLMEKGSLLRKRIRETLGSLRAFSQRLWAALTETLLDPKRLRVLFGTRIHIRFDTS